MRDWFNEHFSWMQWTVPSAAVFAILVAAIVGMIVWDRIQPGYARKGLLPFATTRGDRFFVGVMTLIGVHLVWLALIGATALWAALAIAAALFALILRWG